MPGEFVFKLGDDCKDTRLFIIIITSILSLLAACESVK